MDVARLRELELPDASGTARRIGTFWEQRPVVLVFLRHFGWLHCREHVAQLRDRYDDITTAGADIVAIGTGDVRYAERFVRDTGTPFPVLVDDDGAAADAVSVATASWYRLLHPTTWRATRETSKRGYHVARAGKRVRQLGGTFVIAPGDDVRYEHIDRDSTDHAPVDAVLAALAASPR